MADDLTRQRPLSLFGSGFLAGIVALAFNFLLRLAGYAAFPPEAALSAFLRVVPASIEEPAVQQLGELAGQLGLIVATLVAAAVYGLIVVGFDRFLVGRMPARRLNRFEVLLALSLVPWLLFGVVLLPLLGVSFFGTESIAVQPGDALLLPLTLLLSQAVFALTLSPRYDISTALPQESRPAGSSRREFIEKSAVGLAAVAAGVVGLTSLGSYLAPQVSAPGGSQPVDLQGAPAVFRDPRLSELVSSEITPNGSFYRVAIDLIDPTVNGSTWSLQLDGLVGSQKRYTLDDLMGLPQRVQYTTFECVSNDINGNLISNAKWGGVRLSDLFNDAGGAASGATYVVFRSVDGYSVGIPLSKALMDDSILAYRMNDQALPTRHGYPLRAVIPGLYGMMSAKWINEVTLVDSTYEGYWQTRGWTNEATINTVTFIVTPQTGSETSLSKNGGSVMFGGYAFAGNRGISKVELSFDDGATWQEATLKSPLSRDTWVLWALEWVPPKTGTYFVYARATDGAGAVQTSNGTPTFPNGATGYAYIDAKVAA